MLFRLISLHSTVIYNTPRYTQTVTPTFILHSFIHKSGHGTRTRHTIARRRTALSSHLAHVHKGSRGSPKLAWRETRTPDSQTRIRDANPYGKGSGSETVQPTLHSQHTQTGTSHLIHSQHVNTQRRSPLVGHTSHSRHVGKDSKTLITPHCSFTTHQHAKRTRHVNFPSRQVKSNRSAIKKRHAFENV